MPYFNLLEKTPVLRAALQKYVYSEIINGAVSFIMRLEISSYSNVFVVFNDIIIFTISYVQKYCQLIFAKGLLVLYQFILHHV